MRISWKESGARTSPSLVAGLLGAEDQRGGTSLRGIVQARRDTRSSAVLNRRGHRFRVTPPTRSASTPMPEKRDVSPTKAAAYPLVWVMLPTIPSGQSGAPLEVRPITASPCPNFSNAACAHARPRANSRCLFGTAFSTSASSAGRSKTCWPKSSISAPNRSAARIRANSAIKPGPFRQRPGTAGR